MKIAIYSPYLDTFGGGEKYMATIAEILSKQHSVDLLFDPHLQSFGMDTLQRQLSERFNLDLSRLNLTKAPIGKASNIFQRLIFLKIYDLLFYLTDGSIFYPFSKKNILHIQTPLVGQAKTLFGGFKLKGWNLIIYNSKFTQKFSEENWPIKSLVIYPPVDVMKIKPLKKKKNILSVGRFFGYLRNKKHEVFINTFKELYKDGRLIGWSLHLAGSASEGDKLYINELRNFADKLPVNFYPNLKYDELVKLYGESSIYWHAAGYGEDDPTRMEHFGISTVEAMAAGCVPVVIGKGGQIEIVEHGKNGFLWNNLDELKRFTLELVENADVWEKMSKRTRIRAKNFSKENFTQAIRGIL